MSNIVVNEIHGQDYYNYIIKGDAGMNLLVAGTQSVHPSGQAGFALPKGTTAQRPSSPSAGMIRYNTDNLAVEYYTGSQWRSSGGGTGGTASNPFSSLSQADSAGVSDGLYYFTNGSETKQVYVGNFSGTRFLMITSNNASSGTIPSGNNRRSTSYYVNRSGAGGSTLGTPSPDGDYIIGSWINSFNFSQIKVYGFGRGTTNGSTSWTGNRGTTIEATWNTNSLTSVTPRNQVAVIGELSSSAAYFCGDGIRRDNENGGFNANSNQTTVGGVGVRLSSGDPSTGCYLGHGSNEGNYEGWYNNSGNANSQGYTTWVR